MSYFLVRRNRSGYDDMDDQPGSSYDTITAARKAAYRIIAATPSKLIEIYDGRSNYVGTVRIYNGKRDWTTPKSNNYDLKSDGTLGKSLYRECRSRRA